MKPSRLVLASAVVVALAITATMAEARPVAYYSPAKAYLIDWQSKVRARIAGDAGAGNGGVSDQGTYRLITLDQPFSYLYSWGDDGCGHYEERLLTTQFVVQDLPGGKGRIVELGEDRFFGGCQDGQSTPFGSPDDEGVATKRLAMSKRPAMDDLVAGLQLAGPSEAAWGADSAWPSQDVVTVEAGGATFQHSGHFRAAAFSPDGWWVMNLDAGSQRAQTRLELDPKTGGETWLVAEWAGGQPQRVGPVRFVKPLAGAGFGTARQASRNWLSGASVGTNSQFVYALYRDGTGERIQTNLDTGLEYRRPVQAWGLDAADLWVHMDLVDDGSYALNRRWKPLRNEGKDKHWVLESYEQVVDGVSTSLPSRVNYYIDTGKAVPPAAR